MTLKLQYCTPHINKLIHLWLWHFDLHLPLDRVYLNTVIFTSLKVQLTMVDFHVLEAGSLQHLGQVVASFLLDLFTLLQTCPKKKKRQTHFCLGEHLTNLSQNAQIGWSAQRVFFQMKLRKTLGST